MQDVNGGDPHPITPEGITGWPVSPDDKWMLAGRTLTVADVVVSMQGGSVEDIRGLKPNDQILGWTSDGQLYVASTVMGTRAAIHIEKLNPHTGARTAWRDLSMPAIGGIFPDPPVITLDGAAYAFDYRLRLSDLYTVTGVR
jgi:hypothetical protein